MGGGWMVKRMNGEGSWRGEKEGSYCRLGTDGGVMGLCVCVCSICLCVTVCAVVCASSERSPLALE